MTLIGFDTALATTSACLLRDDGEAFSTPPPTVDRLLGPARHSQELLPELERLLEESGTGWSDVESIAVGSGPGDVHGPPDRSRHRPRARAVAARRAEAGVFARGHRGSRC